MKGLVMEGGAMRGMFTCGVLDVFMENRHITYNAEFWAAEFAAQEGTCPTGPTGPAGL